MILAAIRKLITGVDPVELNKRLDNIENGGAYAREVAHGVQAEIVHARGEEPNLKAALTGKATAADARLVHMRVDELVVEIARLRAAFEKLIQPPVTEEPGVTLVNGRRIDNAGKLVSDLPVEKTGEPNLRERLDGLEQVPVFFGDAPAVAGSIRYFDPRKATFGGPDLGLTTKVTKARKPKAPKTGGAK